MSEPLVTIAIPVYKRLEYLKEAVASAQAQTYPNIEILMSQDPSDSETTYSIRQWCQSLEENDPRVRYRENSYKLGAGGNSNALADAACGEYITYLADDDRLLPYFVGKMVNHVSSEVSFVFSNHYLIDENGIPLEKRSQKYNKCYYRNIIPHGRGEGLEEWAWRAAIPIVASLMKTEDVRRIRFSEELKSIDWEFFVRFSKKVNTFVFLSEYLSEYRIHRGQDIVLPTTVEEGEKHIHNLLSIPADQRFEIFKRERIGKMIIGVASQCLIHGKTDRALMWIRNRCIASYWQSDFLKVFFILCCSILPDALGAKIYLTFKNLKNIVRKQKA